MEINVSWEEMRKRRIFVATPMYGGNCAGIYVRSIIDAALTFQANGMNLQTFYLFNESLITRARNYCVDAFLRSDCTHLLFIDSDIGFTGGDILNLVAIAGEDTSYDVVCAPYAKKNISWEKIKQACDRGVADENPNELEKFVGDFVFNPIPPEGVTGEYQIRLDQPVEVAEAGTGFMLIKRSVFEKVLAANPDLMYLPDHVRSEDFDGTREIGMYFQAAVDNKTRRYLSEDYWFCQKVREAGMKVYLTPWINLQHLGSYSFGGNLAAMASIGASFTADAEQLKSTKGQAAPKAKHPLLKKKKK